MLNLGLILQAVINLTDLFDRVYKQIEKSRLQLEKELLDKAIQNSKREESTEALSKEIGKLL